MGAERYVLLPGAPRALWDVTEELETQSLEAHGQLCEGTHDSLTSQGQ